ncbi:hypothetical protein [Akkermansia sp.]|uniref:hypothetical protein n=1 Tax=Akkermansia sp. TaxID=1872421 RepID=UPI00267131FD|nr:hypothetical protein [uncultured Akkermansia sp.]
MITGGYRWKLPFHLLSKIYGIFEKLFQGLQKFKKKASGRRRFSIFRVRVQTVFHGGINLFFCVFVKKMILGEGGERSLKQFLSICSNDNIMQMKDLNQRLPFRACCMRNPLAEARKRWERNEKEKGMCGFEIRSEKETQEKNVF